jgi:IMP dehydrogenase/GMP reductase
MFSIRDGLCFDDVLLVPQYSNIASRSTVDLSVQIKNKKYKHPVIPANMQSVTGFEMAKAISKSGGLAIVHRFMDLSEQLDIASKADLNHVGFSVGIKDKDKTSVAKFFDYGVDMFCIDIAHGDSKHGIDMTNWIRSHYPNTVIISGNVATGSGAKRLWDAGADIVKVGVGPGCFAAGTRILMSNGFYKNIEDVKPNDYVINMNGKPVKVLNAFSTGIKHVSKLKNDSFHTHTCVTPDHKFWVGELTPTSETLNKWKQIEDVKHDVLLMPKRINFSLPETFNISLSEYELTPTYNLGYLFGIFLSNHCVIDNDVISWCFDTNDSMWVINDLCLVIKNIFNESAKIEINENTTKVIFHNKQLSDFLNSFGKEKKIPENLLVNNKKYLNGLYDGLSDVVSNYGEYYTNDNTFELFDIVHYLLVGYFPKHSYNQDNCGLPKYFSIVKKLQYEDTNIEVPVYDITVDCDTHSFIANNMIVHNSLCTTRIETGCGVPQLTALMDVANIREEINNPNIKVISDGGIKNAGDIVKALCLSDMVMAGNIFAGCVETPGNVLSIMGKSYKEYKGSSTHKSNHIEGVTAIVPTKGTFESVLNKLLEGVSSGLSYQGAHNLEELKENPEFIKMSSSGIIESMPHDVIWK